MNTERSITTHPPFFQPHVSPEQAQQERAEQNENVQAASREAVERDHALIRAMNRSSNTRTAELPQLRAPVLPEDFTEQTAQLDNMIFERGIGIDRERLLTLGTERFQELLELDHAARKDQRITIAVDLADWRQVEGAFYQLHALRATAVPRRTDLEIGYGKAKDRGQAAAFNGFADLWKALDAGEPETVRNCLAFHDGFESLAFGRSLLDRLSKDGRCRSRFFAGGHGRRVELFDNWREVLQAPLVSVTLPDALWSIVGWLANEQTPRPDTQELARRWFNIRLPTQPQIRTVEAVFNGFLLGRTGWSLWEYVGQATRTVEHQSQLAERCLQFGKEYPRIRGFHEGIKTAFDREVRDGPATSHRELDAVRYRAFTDVTIQGLLDCVSAVLALALTENGAVVVARFQEQMLCEGKPKQRAKLSARLAAAFPGSSFTVEVSEEAK